MYELSLVELESELSAELPTRNLMRRRRHMGGGTSAHASFGSGANANSTDQLNSNAQTVVNSGTVKSGGIRVSSYNTNSNHNTQTATPLNFGIGY
jgi:hypothetical protein